MTQVSDRWLTPFSTDVPAGADGLRFLDQVPTEVRHRTRGRTNSERERYCLVASLKWLLRHKPSLFPAQIERQAMNQSPDFILRPKSGGRPIAIEQTDAGHRSHHRNMDRLELEGGVWPPPGCHRIWSADLAKKRFVKQIAIALCKKRSLNTWRDAPTCSVRYIVVYDNTSVDFLILDEDVPALVATALILANWPNGPEELFFFVRADNRIFVTEGRT